MRADSLCFDPPRVSFPVCGALCRHCYRSLLEVNWHTGPTRTHKYSPLFLFFLFSPLSYSSVSSHIRRSPASSASASLFLPHTPRSLLDLPGIASTCSALRLRFVLVGLFDLVLPRFLFLHLFLTLNSSWLRTSHHRGKQPLSP